MKQPRPLTALALLLLIPPVAGALLSPLVWGALPALAARFPGVAFLHEASFGRVLNRCVVFCIAVLLVPAFRSAGVAASLKSSLRMTRDRACGLGLAVALGCASMLLAYAAGWVVGAYRLATPLPSIGTFFTFLTGAVFVGLFEEIFFRGFLFGALRMRLSFWPAAIAASLLFSLVHFLTPDVPAGFDAGHWYSGFAAFGWIPETIRASEEVVFAVTLVLMGVTLCAWREARGHLWFAIGLHGGWVWAMLSGGALFDRNWAILRPVFGGGNEFVARAPVAIPIVTLFLAVALLARRRASASPPNRP